MKLLPMALVILLGGCTVIPVANIAATKYGPDCLPRELTRSLAEIERRYGKVTVISTYRKGAIIAGTNRPSLHASCRAIDFHPKKGTYKKVVSWLRKNTDHFVITYSGRFHHIHIDNSRKGYAHKRG